MPADTGILPADIRARLETRTFGRRFYYLPEVDSTNRLAREFAEAGEPHGTVIASDFQRQGRGRHGRPWTSPPGRNLLFSLILRPDMSPRQVLPVTLAFSLAATDVLGEHCGREARVKWPNDILMDGRKMGGILSESASRAGRTNWVVAGIGINVNMRSGEFPEDMPVPGVSCLMVAGRECDRPHLFADLLQCLESMFDRFAEEGFAGIRTHYLARLASADVAFERRGQPVRGTVAGVLDDGALVVRTRGGEEMSLYDEEISI